MDYRELLRAVRKRPGMYFGRSDLTYRELIAFVEGLGFGHPGLMTGFREFLVLKLDDGDNLGWPMLVERLASVDSPIDAAFDLLDEFLAETRGTDASAILPVRAGRSSGRTRYRAPADLRADG